MTLLVERPTEASDSAQETASDRVQETQVLFEEARRRRRRRRLTSGVIAVVIGVGVLAWWLSTGAARGQPPATPSPFVGNLFAPSVPPGATLIQTRSVSGWSLRIFASPSGLQLAKVKAEYELFDPHGSPQASGSSTVGPVFAPGTGVLNLDGDSSSGPDGFQIVRNYPVTLPTITTVRVVDGDKVLDSMSPVTFDGVRFVVLAVINVPSLHPLVLQGLDAEGTVISSAPYQLPDRRLPMTPVTRPGTSGGGSFHTTTGSG